jgi:hypothetical protein
MGDANVAIQSEAHKREVYRTVKRLINSNSDILSFNERKYNEIKEIVRELDNSMKIDLNKVVVIILLMQSYNNKVINKALHDITL